MAGELIRREALERIIQRAAELQAGEPDLGGGPTEPELLALGQEVGIPPRYLRQALLEEPTRSGVAPERGVVAWLAGPLALTARRVAPGHPAAPGRAVGGSSWGGGRSRGRAAAAPTTRASSWDASGCSPGWSGARSGRTTRSGPRRRTPSCPCPTRPASPWSPSERAMTEIKRV